MRTSAGARLGRGLQAKGEGAWHSNLFLDLGGHPKSSLGFPVESPPISKSEEQGGDFLIMSPALTLCSLDTHWLRSLILPPDVLRISLTLCGIRFMGVMQ